MRDGCISPTTFLGTLNTEVIISTVVLHHWCRSIATFIGHMTSKYTRILYVNLKQKILDKLLPIWCQDIKVSMHPALAALWESIDAQCSYIGDKWVEWSIRLPHQKQNWVECQVCWSQLPPTAEHILPTQIHSHWLLKRRKWNSEFSSGRSNINFYWYWRGKYRFIWISTARFEANIHVICNVKTARQMMDIATTQPHINFYRYWWGSCVVCSCLYWAWLMPTYEAEPCAFSIFFLFGYGVPTSCRCFFLCM